MLTRKKVIEILQYEEPYLRSNFGVKKIAIFGSVAKNAQMKDSDVDILVELEKPIGLKFIDLAEYLEKALGRKIDILTSNAIRAIRIKKVAQRIKESLVYV